MLEKNQNKNRVVLITQSLVIPLFRLTCRHLISPVSKTELVLSAGTTYLIVSNHQSMLDPFVIAAAIPPIAFAQLKPLRFLTANGYMKILPLRPIMYLLGCIKARHDGSTKSGVTYAKRRLQNGENLLIFPEGRRALIGQIEPKKGVASLATTSGVRVIPVFINWRRRSFWKRRAQVNFGIPYSAQGKTAAQIMETLYSLR